MGLWGLERTYFIIFFTSTEFAHCWWAFVRASGWVRSSSLVEYLVWGIHLSLIVVSDWFQWKSAYVTWSIFLVIKKVKQVTLITVLHLCQWPGMWGIVNAGVYGVCWQCFSNAVSNTNDQHSLLHSRYNTPCIHYILTLFSRQRWSLLFLHGRCALVLVAWLSG